MSSPKRSLSLAFLPCLLLVLWGCGAGDPFSIFDGGPIVERVGVINFPASYLGDFEPRTLVAQTSIPLNATAIQSIVQTRLPEADLIFNSTASSSFQAVLPLGMTLAEGATALRKEPTVEEVLPRFVDNRSTEVSLVLTSTTDFVYRATRLTLLVAEDTEMLRDYDKSWVVRIRARARDEVNPVSPTDYVQVLSVEKVTPHRITLEGTLTLHGSTRSCLLLHRDNGDLVSLLGSTATTLSQNYTLGQRVQVVIQDLGNSTDACSGGLRGLVESYTLL